MENNKHELKFEKCTFEEAYDKGYPTFNICDHYVVDMSNFNPKEGYWMNTISIKLPDDIFVTMCVMKTSEEEICIDTKFHGDGVGSTRVIGFGGEGRDTSIPNKKLYALLAHKKIKK